MVEHDPNFWERLVTMNPAVLRGLILGIIGLVTLVTGSVIDEAAVDNIVNVVLLALTLISGFVIKGAVTPNAKVIAFQPNPIDEPHVIEAGEATIQPGQEEALVDAAHAVPRAA